MSEIKPQKRIVSKGRYVRVMGKRLTLYSVASAIQALGFLGLSIVVILLIMAMEPRVRAVFLVLSGVLALISLPCLFLSKRLFVRVRAMEAVAPITDRNAHLLPAEESLLRGSDISPTEQQAELLRAVQTGQETPPEQLLRSVAGNE